MTAVGLWSEMATGGALLSILVCGYGGLQVPLLVGFLVTG